MDFLFAAPMFLILIITNLGVASSSNESIESITSESMTNSRIIASSDFVRRKPETRDSLREIKTAQDFHDLSNQEPGGLVRSGQVLKFLVDNRNYPKSDIYYLNSHYCERMMLDAQDSKCKYVYLHREFANKKFNKKYAVSQYNDIAYNTSDLSTKKFIDGRIQVFDVPDSDSSTPNARKQIYGVWFIERDLISEAGVLYVLKKVKESFHLTDNELFFVQYNQKQTTNTIASTLAAMKIGITSIDKILMGVAYLPLNSGVAYGYLRYDPKGDVFKLNPTDIPVFSVLPLDLGVVAGTITTSFQDVASHINLKARERKTPNIAILSPDLVEKLKAFNNKPVKLTVTPNSYEIVDSTVEEIESHQTKITEWLQARTDLSIKEPLLYSKMCAKIKGRDCLRLAGAFGGKVMQLGFLAREEVLGGRQNKLTKQFNYPLSPTGFGIPVSFYHEFMEHNKIKNSKLSQNIETLVKNEKKELQPSLTPDQRIALISEIQDQIRNGEFPEELINKILKTLAEFKKEVMNRDNFELKKIKVRSSANVEDIAGFDGAGLHDSFSAKVSDKFLTPELNKSTQCNIKEEKVVIKDNDGNASEGEDSDNGLGAVKQEIEPKTIFCAIKSVYASLFNPRAIAERSFRGFDHDSAMMGIAVVPSYKSNDQKIKANSVLITRVLNTESVYGYQLATQVGNNLATNPLPGTISEMVVIAFQKDATKAGPSITIQRFAKVDPNPNAPYLDKTILAEQEIFNIQKIGRHIEEEYCKAKVDYFKDCSAVSNSARKERSLDMEIKIYDDGKLLFKQFREFSGK